MPLRHVFPSLRSGDGDPPSIRHAIKACLPVWDLGKIYIRWDKVFETLADALITYDTKGRIFSWNITARELYGYQFSKILGKSIKTLSESDNNSDILSLLKPDFPLRNFALNRVTKDKRY